MKTMTLEAYLDSVPPIPNALLLEALTDLIEHYVFEEERDYRANRDMDHIFLRWLVLLKFLKTVADGDELH